MNFTPVNIKIKQEDDEALTPFREESRSDAISTQASETNIKQEEDQDPPEPTSPPTQPPPNLKKASRETLRKLACEGSLEASELLSERRAKDRAGYEQRKVHLANGRASTLASYKRQRENGKRRRARRKREARQKDEGLGLSEDVIMESTEIQDTLQQETMSGGVQEEQSSFEGVDGEEEMTEAEETVAKIDEQRWDCEICWSIYEALGW